ncbi:MAG: DUF2842 domain-containing protein [Defluviimonas sp.]|uniref:DUF2842 domain-containing protein n=1 Tax=Albidovulum sp. TaxID=1872424 RepID=UPI001D7BA4CF|nr:DUF2842 domain-containing protein [Paracoccaceae bacterium]MCC0063701.1 DUF2842 domain-containing protein [Defluviimonas sp.]
MSLGYKARRRLSLLVLLVGLPLYIVAAVSLANWIDATWGRQPIWIELGVYIGLGVLWILPLRPVFRGVGRADPGAQTKTERSEDRSA